MTSAKRPGNKTNLTAAFAALALLLLCPAAARAQWTTPDASGNVNIASGVNKIGVGTASPPSKLTVNVTSNADGITVDGTMNPMFSLKTSGVAKGYLGVATTVSAYAVGAAPGDIILRTQGGRFFFETNSGVGTPALTIAGGNGGVGIGTSTPSNALHVHSASGAQAVRVSGSGGGLVNFMDTSAGANQKLYQWRSEGGLFRMSLSNDSEASFAQQNLLVANSSGNIGIGTSSPTSKLHVGVGTSQTLITIDGSAGASYNGLVLNTAGTQKWFFGRDGADGTDDFILRSNSTSNVIRAFSSGAAANTLVLNSGKVGIGIQNPTHTLEVAGTINATGDITGATINATYQDVAEWVPSTQRLSAGTVVVLDTGKTNHVLASTKAYDTGVAGVISDSPGIILGVGGAEKLKVATTGRVKVKVDATRGAIKVGDLLVTSEVEGMAMRSVEVDLGGVRIHRPGTIIGKALEPLASGTGEVLVLLSLQ